MRSAVRLILVLLVVALIFNNYNSLKILNLTIESLEYDLEQRASLITQEISRQADGISQQEFQTFLTSRLETYSLQAIAIYNTDGRVVSRVTHQLKGEAAELLERPPGSLLQGESLWWKTYLLIPQNFGPQNKVIAVFNGDRILGIERSAKMITYLNFLLMGFAGLLGFYFLESVLRPYRLLLQTARSAPASLRPEENRSEPDFVISTFRGVITKLKEKEQELAKLHLAEKARADDVQRLNQDLLRSISSGLMLIDQAGRIDVFNHAAEKILQVPAEHLLGQPFQEAIGRISTAFEQDIERCFAERVNLNRAELEIATSQGEVRFLGANIMPLQDRQQNFSGVFCIFTDITEFKLLQQHMALKEKFASLGEMAAFVAHEFRNSLGTITGYVQLLENGADQAQRDYLDPMGKELQVLQNVVNDFLTFARPAPLQLGPVHLGDLLQDCVEEAKVNAMQKSVDFCLDGTFLEVTGDEGALRQVFLNLLRNGAESIDGCGRKGKVQVNGRTAQNGKFAIVEVRDNGIGIPQQDLSRIFTPFFSTKEQGVGLGLAIVQKMILQHNGAISVESSSEGSVFRLQLPLS